VIFLKAFKIYLFFRQAIFNQILEVYKEILREVEHFKGVRKNYKKLLRTTAWEN
jgi:hypothetical protein